MPAPTYPGFAMPLPYSRRWSRAALELDLDIFHAQHPFLLGVTARRLARAQGRPLVFTYHTRYEKYAHYVPLPEPLVAAIAVRLASRFAGSADLVIAPSARIAESLDATAACRRRSPSFPRACPSTSSGRAIARMPGAVSACAEDVPLCLYVGRLDREKSVERVIEAFGSIAAGRVGRAAPAGRAGQPRDGALSRLAAASPARSRIRFAGSVAREALPPYYQAADLFLFSSETETQGLVLAEAHACGLPAVAVRASGVDEVVRDGETGLLDEGRRRGAGRRGHRPPARPVAGGAPWRCAARALAESDFSAARQVEVMVGHYQQPRWAAWRELWLPSATGTSGPRS